METISGDRRSNCHRFWPLEGPWKPFLVARTPIVTTTSGHQTSKISENPQKSQNHRKSSKITRVYMTRHHVRMWCLVARNPIDTISGHQKCHAWTPFLVTRRNPIVTGSGHQPSKIIKNHSKSSKIIENHQKSSKIAGNH